MAWSPTSWKAKVEAQAIPYEDSAALESALTRLRSLPPLVTSWEIERLKHLLADAQEGRRFLVQGGDCAETLADCRSPVIADKLKILLQMSLVMIHEGKRPVIRVGRFAGQYAKPRSNPLEDREGVVRPSYFGDLVNREAFTEGGRRPDPDNLLVAYSHAALTLNFVRPWARRASRISPASTSTRATRGSASTTNRPRRGRSPAGPAGTT